MAKIIFFECVQPEQAAIEQEINRLGAASPIKLADCSFVAEKLTAETASLAADADIVSVFINSRADKAAIQQLGKARLIATRSTGFDHIDGACARERGMTVANVPAYGSRTVAEYAFALTLALSRKIPDADARVRSGSMDTAGLMGFDLQNKTFGIIGTGRIGQNAAQIARGFDMNVIAYDAFQNAEAAARIGFTYVSLDELLAQSDVVSLHVPANKDTINIINSGNIGRFKKGALLINTARGEVCETAAIEQGLREGILGGAGLDVVAGSDAALLAMPNVIITPHSAYYTREAQQHIAQTTVENMAGFLTGAIKNQVNT